MEKFSCILYSIHYRRCDILVVDNEKYTLNFHNRYKGKVASKTPLRFEGTATQ